MHLVLMIGPPAVGKMTVGQEIARRTTYRLFHNHQSIDPLLSVFDHGTPSFTRLNGLIRREVLAEAMDSGVPGLIFTVVVALDDPVDVQGVEDYVRQVVDAGGRVDVVELTADLDTRIAREGSENRLLHKSSKRDVEWAKANVREMERDFVMASAELPGQELPWGWPYRVFDTVVDSPGTVAERIVEALDLPRP